jgi:hypothetical protein
MKSILGKCARLRKPLLRCMDALSQDLLRFALLCLSGSLFGDLIANDAAERCAARSPEAAAASRH